MSRYRPNPPPLRMGVSPSCVVLPVGAWQTVADFLELRFPAVSRAQWVQRMDAGEVIDSEGTPVEAAAAFTPGRRLYYYRTVEQETPIPFEAEVLHQDAHLLVVDKPHFLPVIPSGKYVQETVLVRLKHRLKLPDLSPIHRIDRDTAGLVLFSVNPSSRNAYQSLFRHRQVDKTYECIAPWNPALPWPLQRESRIAPAEHFMQQTEVSGAPNALTHIAPLEVHGKLARYTLKPVSGQRHQLRVHMAALGLPIVNDGIYPTLTPEGADYTKPLQLLARAIAFTDPVSGEPRQFSSQRSLLNLADIQQT
ncbi:MAG: pseudouridine synthase [Burkholderiales bacterium]|nr:pseudouridine synthase [Burkholderiales bacterium]